MVRIKYTNPHPENDWRNVKGFPRYEVNAEGRVRNRETGKPLTVVVSNGSARISLVNEQRRKIKVSMLKLMLEAFEVDTKGLVPMHINGMKFENDLRNIGLMSRKDRDALGKRGKTVFAIDKGGNVVKIYASCLEASRESGITLGRMRRMLKKDDGYMIKGRRYVYEEMV